MSMFFFTYRSRTRARMGLAALRQAGIDGRLSRTPGSIAESGCGHGLWVRERDAGDAAALLREARAPFEKCYRQEKQGFREVEI